jgi:heme exporter protein A
VIRVDGLDKRYGRRRVLRGLSFSVARGETLLVTGPNGSGKTTLLRILVGLAAPSGGAVEVAADRAGVGYVGHEPMLYRELSADENMALFGQLYRVADRRDRTDALLCRFGLEAVRGERVSSFSRGMTQRLALCRALLHEPSLLVLDEPFTALDEDGAALLDRELAAAAGSRTVVVSTHDPARLATLATARLVLV